MNTDRELLELAAKAAGIVGSVEEFYRRIGDKTPFLAIATAGDTWDPLHDDGDALRLAVKLRLAVNIWNGCSVMTSGELNATCVFEDMGTDPYAITRRAIVRAAAAIGATE